MANIIEKKKISRVLHRFDTAENWKNSLVQLLPGEIAFDEQGNFKVGLRQGSGNTWSDLPYAGRSKFISGSLSSRPSNNDGNSYAPGDMFKDTTTNKWYFLSGIDSYGEFQWEEITFSTKDFDFVLEEVEEIKKDVANKADIEDITALEEIISTKANKEDLSEFATKNELVAVADIVDEQDDKISSMEETIVDMLSQLEETVSSEDLQTSIENIIHTTNEQVQIISSEISKKADKEDVNNRFHEIKENIQSLDEELRLEIATSNEQLSSDVEQLMTTKVDISALFDESGIIKTSLIPGSVDDIIEGVLVEDGSFNPLDPISQVNVGGKLYLDVNTKELYRWSGSQYVLVSSGSNLILGTKEGTAYEGSAGKLLEDKVAVLETNVVSNGSRLSAVESTVSKHNDNIASLSTDLSATKTLVDGHTTSIIALGAKDEIHDSKIADIQAINAEQATTLTDHEKRIVTLENKATSQQSEIDNLKTETKKISTFEKEIKTFEKEIDNFGNNIDTLNITIGSFTPILTEQATKIASLETQNNINTNNIHSLTNTVQNNSDKITNVESNILSLNQNVSDLERSVSRHQTFVEQTDVTLYQYNNRLVELEKNDGLQETRIQTLENDIKQQNVAITEVKTTVNLQSEKVNYLEKKVDSILGVETENGTMSLGLMAFKDNVTNEDITGVHISKVYQGDEEVELWCGNSED